MNKYPSNFYNKEIRLNHFQENITRIEKVILTKLYIENGLLIQSNQIQKLMVGTKRR
jgi:hypothetical protein